MRDAALTMRVPLERLEGQLTDEQKARLNGGDPGRTTAATPPTTEGRADATARSCSAQMPMMGGGPIEAIGHAVRPTEQQRAGLEALQMTTMGMAQLVMASCPTEQPAGAVARLGIETDRITFMLFAVKTTSAAFSSFYRLAQRRAKGGLQQDGPAATVTTRMTAASRCATSPA